MTSAEDPILRDLEIMAGAVRYRAWIHSLLAPWLGRRVVEVGSGIGTFTELLLERAEVVATDVYPPAVERLRQRFGGRPGFEARLLDVSSPPFRELRAFRPDTIVCSNVLEHVRDDRGALAAMREVLVDGGHVVLLVPAFQAAFGTIDRLVGHERRYGRSELRDKLRGAGLELRRLHYVNAVALPAWFVNGRVLKRQAESPGQVLVFDRLVVPWLSRLERLVRPPFGMSLFAAARR
jgi:SAM-dependent methyltransferase